MEAAPGKARERRRKQHGAARVERWAGDSGNAALMGRELPPDEVLAADQGSARGRVSCAQAGLEGGMDELRARAFLKNWSSAKTPPPARETVPSRLLAGGGLQAGSPGGSR